MTARTRLAAKTVTTTRQIVPAGSSPITTLKLIDMECQDVINDYGNEHTLMIDRVTRHYDPIGGNSKNSVTDPTYTIYDGNWMYEFQQTSGASHLSLAGLPSNNQVGIQTLSRSNPSRPHIDLPLFLYELREIPQMLKYLASYLKRTGQPLPFDTVSDVGGLVLTAEYGIKPLVRDLQKFFDFQSQVSAVEKRIRALNSRGGIHSKVDIGNWTGYARSTPVFNSEGGIVISGTVDKLTVCSIWGTTRWSADLTHDYPVTNDEILRKARQVVLGTDIGIDTIYNGIPWSWLLDWASNTGSYLSTFRNTIPAKHSKVCVMKHRKTTETGKKTSSNGTFMTGGKSFMTVHETKERSVMPFLLPELSLPNLTARQLSILGSLAVQRIPRDTMRYITTG